MSSSETTSSIFKNWLLNSPSNGIRRIGRAKTFTSSLIWAYISWIFTIMMSTFIYTVILYYNASPTKTHLSLRQYRDSANFPAITFCNIISFDSRKHFTKLICLLGNINPLQDDGFLNDVRKSRLPGGDSSHQVGEKEYLKAVSAYIDRILAAQVNGGKHPFLKWGFKLNDLLITCIFNKKECHRNLTQLFHPNYGNCYTFDSEHNVKQELAKNVRHDWSIDDNNGHNNYKLFLELFLHQAEYNEYLENRAAFRIFIHRKHEVPILSQNSLFLGPNKYTKLSFSQRIIRFSRHCRKDLTDDMKQIFRTHKIRYTQALCYKLCEQRFLEKQCLCIEPTLAVFYQFFNNTPTENISLCSIDNKCLNSLTYFSKF